MKLGLQVGLGPGHIVLDGDPARDTANEVILARRAAAVYIIQFSLTQVGGVKWLFLKITKIFFDFSS